MRAFFLWGTVCIEIKKGVWRKYGKYAAMDGEMCGKFTDDFAVGKDRCAILPGDGDLVTFHGQGIGAVIDRAKQKFGGNVHAA